MQTPQIKRMQALIFLVVSLLGLVIDSYSDQFTSGHDQSIIAIASGTAANLSTEKQSILIIPGLSFDQLITIVDEDGRPLSFRRIDNEKVDLGRYRGAFQVRFLNELEGRRGVNNSGCSANPTFKRS